MARSRLPSVGPDVVHSGSGPAGRAGEAPLLGRASQLAELAAGLAQASAGQGRLFTVVGEPGIGKTRLVEELGQRAEREGALVLWARGWEGGGAPAYWPWVQVLRGLAAERDVHQLEPELGRGGGWVAQLVPELSERLPDLPEPGFADSEQARFALFDAVTSFLVRASAEVPLVVVLDDLHAAFEPSLLLLAFFARAIPDAAIMVVASHQEPVPEAPAEVHRLLADLRRSSRRIVLGGLGLDDLGRLIEHRGGSRAASELVAAVHEATEGNPFFSDELVRLLAADDRLAASADAAASQLPLPDSVREAIGLRLEPLGERALGTLAVASVIGRTLRLATLERATGRGREELLELLDQAVAANLLRPLPSMGEYAFTHGLVRETLYCGLGSAERMRAHRAVGEALERMRGAVAEESLSELAFHFLEAAPAGDPLKAVDYAQRAGDRAMALLAYERAAQLFEDALRALELDEAGDDARRAALLLSLGRARLRAGHADTRATILAAAAAARELGDAELLAEAALGLGGLALSPGVVDRQFVTLLEEALAALGKADSSARARVLVRLAEALHWSPAAERRAALVEQALAVARRTGDPATLAYVLSHAIVAARGPDSTQRALGWARELFELSQAAGNVELGIEARSVQIDLLLELGDAAAADSALRTFERAAAEAGEPRARSLAPLHRARQALAEGRLDEAERLSAQGRELGAQFLDSTAPMIAAAQDFVARWYRGRLGELETELLQLADEHPGMPSWRASVALLYREAGRGADARREFERLAAHDFEDLPRHAVWFVAVALLAEVCHYLDDRPRAALLRRQLEPYRDRNVVAPVSAGLGPVARFLGLLAATEHDWEAAAAHFQAAREANQRLPSPPLAAMLAVDEARMLVARGRQGDGARAAALLSEAEAIAEPLGLVLAQQRAQEVRQATELPAAPALEPVSLGATEAASLRREGDIWTLALGGRLLRLRDAKGLRHLALLLANPGVEFHSLDLVAAGEGRSEALAPTRAGTAAPELAPDAGPRDAGAVLDPQAKAAYRSRLEDLREELGEAETFNDPERAARAREEIEFLGRELAGALGLGGRDRRAASDAERARVNVTRAVRGVIRRVEEEDPALGRELETTVRTGIFCCYRPDPRRPVAWDVDAG